MNKSSLSLLKSGMAVTFNWGKDAKGNPILRKGIFKKMSGKYESKALVLWQKDDETSPSNHYVTYTALHNPEIDAYEAKLAKQEADAKAERKAEKLQKQAEKQAEKVARKAPKTIKKSVKKSQSGSLDERVLALRNLADALQSCSDLGIDLTKFGL